ncbi:hypothetical protein DB31_1851 [Hyalangium minutum]|uniref:Tryptophan 2-monooxygenase n=1 Tax=Hyalangium minutum TaxID=394096 RepID=A0A085WAX0_9BACT|nr:FAD-dependent oxidoreductase [Hyalangium minutum]KFE64833.1 hypothetical protein DB31_1851 [Hyalangium minutum]
MARTPLFELFRQTTRIALASEREGVPSREAAEAMRVSRRALLKGATVLGAGLVAGAGKQASAELSLGGGRTGELRVGIVGAGIAGLACAYDLKRAGILATLHETNDRPGGRIFSMGGAFPGPVNFPGQVVERGGEFIDTGHKTMLGYAQEFGLAKEDVTKAPGEVFYYFGGRLHGEVTVVDEYRAFVSAIRPDLRALSSAPTADTYTSVDRQFDLMDLRTYLETRGAGPVAKAAIIAAYEAEYGLAAHELSCLNFLFFIRANRRSRFEPFGVSDERYHLVGGNQQIPQGLAARLPGQIRYGERLESARKTAAGAVELSFRRGSTSIAATYDAVVFAIPFTVLRTVALDVSLALPAWKTLAINQMGYGTNAKMMVGFNGPFWAEAGATAPRTRTCRTTKPRGRRTPRTPPPRAPCSRTTRAPRAGPTWIRATCRARWIASWQTWAGSTRARRSGSRGTRAARPWRTWSTGRPTRTRGAATRPTGLGSSPRSAATRASPWATSSSPASTPTRSMGGRASWRAAPCPGRTRPPPSSPR